MKVLVVDDEPLVRRALGRLGEFRHHQVYLAEDGEKGLQLWRNLKPHLVFLDVLMPKMTGPEVLEQVGPLSGTVVILMSAFSAGYDKGKGLEMGADLFLEKPFENILEVFEQAEALVGVQKEGVLSSKFFKVEG